MVASSFTDPSSDTCQADPPLESVAVCQPMQVVAFALRLAEEPDDLVIKPWLCPDGAAPMVCDESDGTAWACADVMTHSAYRRRWSRLDTCIEFVPLLPPPPSPLDRYVAEGHIPREFNGRPYLACNWLQERYGILDAWWNECQAADAHCQAEAEHQAERMRQADDQAKAKARLIDEILTKRELLPRGWQLGDMVDWSAAKKELAQLALEELEQRKVELSAKPLPTMAAPDPTPRERLLAECLCKYDRLAEMVPKAPAFYKRRDAYCKWIEALNDAELEAEAGKTLAAATAEIEASNRRADAQAEARRKADNARIAPRPAAASVPAASKLTPAVMGGPPADAIDYTPEAADYQQILKTLQVDVLGKHADNSILIYSQTRRQINCIPDISSFAYVDLIQYVGDPAIENAHDGREDLPGRFPMYKVKEAIAYASGRRLLDENSFLGQGVWSVGKDVVIVNGDHGLVCRDGKLEVISSPIHGDRVLDFRAVKQWLNETKLAAYLEKAVTNRTWAHGVIKEAQKLFRQWKWAAPVDAEVAVGLMLATWVQTLLPMRPMVAVTGKTNAGKSRWCAMFDDMFGRLARSKAKPTEAALRQMIQHNSYAVIIDELENNHHRRSVLEMLRTTTRGTRIIRGTPDGQGREYGLHHVVWIAGIELGLVEEADRNRYIVMEMTEQTNKKWAERPLPATDVIADLGLKLLALAVCSARKAIEIFEGLKSHAVAGTSGRLAEIYAVPAAMLAAVFGAGDACGKKLLERFVAGRKLDEEVQSDEAQLLRDLLAAHVQSALVRYSVAQVATDQDKFTVVQDDIELYGVSFAHDKAGGRKPTMVSEWEVMFVVPDIVRRKLLADTRWRDLDLKQILLRIKNAKPSQRNLAGGRPRGIDLPRASLNEALKAEAQPASTKPTLEQQVDDLDLI